MPRVLLTVTLAILSTAAQGKLRPSSVTKPKTMPPTTDSFKIRASTTVELPKSFSEDGHAGLEECFKQRYRYDSRFFVSGSVVLEERYDQVLTRSNTFDKAAQNISTGFEKEFRGTFKNDCSAEYTDYTGDGRLCPSCGYIEFNDTTFCMENWETRSELSVSAPPTTHVYDLSTNIHFIVDPVPNPNPQNDSDSLLSVCDCEQMHPSTFTQFAFDPHAAWGSTPPPLAKVEGSYVLGKSSLRLLYCISVFNMPSSCL